MSDKEKSMEEVLAELAEKIRNETGKPVETMIISREDFEGMISNDDTEEAQINQ